MRTVGYNGLRKWLKGQFFIEFGGKMRGPENLNQTQELRDGNVVSWMHWNTVDTGMENLDDIPEPQVSDINQKDPYISVYR